MGGPGPPAAALLAALALRGCGPAPRGVPANRRPRRAPERHHKICVLLTRCLRVSGRPRAPGPALAGDGPPRELRARPPTKQKFCEPTQARPRAAPVGGSAPGSVSPRLSRVPGGGRAAARPVARPGGGRTLRAQGSGGGWAALAGRREQPPPPAKKALDRMEHMCYYDGAGSAMRTPPSGQQCPPVVYRGPSWAGFLCPSLGPPHPPALPPPGEGSAGSSTPPAGVRTPAAAGTKKPGRGLAPSR